MKKALYIFILTFNISFSQDKSFSCGENNIFIEYDILLEDKVNYINKNEIGTITLIKKDNDTIEIIINNLIFNYENILKKRRIKTITNLYKIERIINLTHLEFSSIFDNQVSNIILKRKRKYYIIKNITLLYKGRIQE